MEDTEAAMWKSLLHMSPGPTRDALKRDHAIYFASLAILEREAAKISRCTHCGDPAVALCGACNTDFYCNAACQRSDWKRHKTLCNIKDKPIDFVPATSATKPHAVLLLLRKGTFTVHMSKEDMTDYDAYVSAVQAVVPWFEKSTDYAWQHWTSVREAFNPARS
jgi:hypothetical protein